jgi:hypothetical protein
VTRAVAGIDPGRRSGLALMAGGRLLGAWTFDGDDLEPQVAALAPYVERVAIETPRAYPGSPVRAQDLVRLARRAEGMAIRLAGAGVAVTLIEPRNWKGTLPKKTFHGRVRRSLDEQDWTSYDKLSEHAKEAVGLALWLDGRLR